MSKKYQRDLDLTVSTKYDIPEETIMVHENLPTFPSYSLCYGPPKNGKTLMMVNFIHNVKHVFKGGIVIFTGNLCKTLWKTKETCGSKVFTSLYDNKGQDRLQQIIDYQFSCKKNGMELDHVLIVLDDFGNNKLFNKRKSSLTTIYTEGRHSNISVWCNIQSPSMVVPIVRDNTMYSFFFCPKVNQRKKIIEENSNWLSEKEFTELFDKITHKKHNFLMIDLNKQIMRENFGDIVSSKWGN